MKGVSTTSTEHVVKTLKMLQWALNNGYFISPKAGEVAARGGNLEILKWLKENDCLGYKEAYVAAAEVGQLEVLKWLDDNGCQGSTWATDVFAAAAEGGHFELLHWLKDNDYEKNINIWESQGKLSLEFIFPLVL